MGLGMEVPVAHRQATVARLKPPAALAVSQDLAMIPQMTQDLPEMFTLILASGQALIQQSTAYHLAYTSCRL